jgi:transcriptional regulator with XRE-family HTH domain
MTDGPNRLGDYLRARRELVTPEQAGVPVLSARRVPGLRREEVAMLAGISADYYLRLEQGRDQHPSPQIIEAVARALRLDEDATAYLHGLAQPEAAPHRGPPERAPASIEQLIASWRETPAFVQDRHLDILAANALASALSPVFSPGVNLVRAVFLDPEVRRLNGDGWDGVAHSAVARLRALAGPDIDDPRLVELVGELSVRSDRFRRLWARHDIEAAAVPGRTLHHPLVGTIEVLTEWLSIAGADGQILVVYHAVPGSPSEQALLRLAGMTGSGACPSQS